jgi:hypothetical protein
MAAQLETWIQGNVAVTTARWIVPPETGTPQDPTAVVFTVRENEALAGTEYEYGVDGEVERDTDADGPFYTLTLQHPTPGRFHVHAQGSGDAEGAGKTSYIIEASEALNP